jgi:hypothetical protein
MQHFEISDHGRTLEIRMRETGRFKDLDNSIGRESSWYLWSQIHSWGKGQSLLCRLRVKKSMDIGKPSYWKALQPSQACRLTSK